MAEDNLSEDVRQQALEAVQGMQGVAVEPAAQVGPNVEDIPDWRDTDAISALQQEKRDLAIADRDDVLISSLEAEKQDMNAIEAMSEEDMESALEAAHMIKDAVEAESLNTAEVAEADITGYSGVTPSLTPDPEMAQPSVPPVDMEMDK